MYAPVVQILRLRIHSTELGPTAHVSRAHTSVQWRCFINFKPPQFQLDCAFIIIISSIVLRYATVYVTTLNELACVFGEHCSTFVVHCGPRCRLCSSWCVYWITLSNRFASLKYALMLPNLVISYAIISLSLRKFSKSLKKLDFWLQLKSPAIRTLVAFVSRIRACNLARQSMYEQRLSLSP